VNASLGNGLDILVIVSEPLMQRIIQRMLERFGHWPEMVSCESDALDSLEQEIFDVMIVDTETLGSSAAQLVNLARMARLGMPPLPVIALGLDSSLSVVSQLEEAGVEAILTKPVPPKTLLETLTKISSTQASSLGLSS
jgi:CheY-like chemotaxis protein